MFETSDLNTIKTLLANKPESVRLLEVNDNSISNANTHNINSSMDMQKLYRYLGLTKFNRNADRKVSRETPNNNQPKKINPILKYYLLQI